MASLACYVAGALALLAAATQRHRTRDATRTPGTGYLTAALVGTGLSAAVRAPTTLRLAAHVAPLPHLARLTGDDLALGTAFCMLGVLARAGQSRQCARRRMRWPLIALVVSLSTVIILMLPGNRFLTGHPGDVGTAHPAAACLVIVLAYRSWGLVGVVLLVARVVRHAERTYLRAGLRLMAIGAGAGLVWSLWTITAAVTILLTRGAPPTLVSATAPAVPVGSLVCAGCVALFAVGAGLPTWGPHAARPARWLRHRRDYHRLAPLWSALHHAVPHVSFTPARANMTFRLYRRIIEIRDGHLALRVYIHPRAAAWAAERAQAAAITDDGEAAALIEAATIAAALEAHRAHHRYHEDPSTADAPRELDPDLAVEARWLVQVARAFTDSPVVEAVRRRVREDLNTTPTQP